MKKILFITGLIFLIFSFSPIFAKGKQDIEEIPNENVEFAIKPDEEIVEKPLEPQYKLKIPEGKPVEVKESWGYVMAGRESEYNSSMPVTDVCFLIQILE